MAIDVFWYFSAKAETGSECNLSRWWSGGRPACGVIPTAAQTLQTKAQHRTNYSECCAVVCSPVLLGNPRKDFVEPDLIRAETNDLPTQHNIWCIELQRNPRPEPALSSTQLSTKEAAGQWSITFCLSCQPI